VFSFLADLADDGRLGSIYCVSQNQTIRYSYKLIHESSSDDSHFDLQVVVGEHALYWQKTKISPEMGMVLLASFPNLQPVSVWISIHASSAIFPCRDPYLIGRGCGGLPL